MYKDFFNLTRSPFGLTPDPAFLFPTALHNEALAALYYGVRYQKGFVVVTGEAGTGKTLLIRCLLRLLKQSNDVACAYLFNCRLSPIEFLQYILADFGLSASGTNKAELLRDLGDFVISRGSKNLTTVLIVDEAHHLSAEILEEICLLTNLETSEAKLLQVILVGQSGLDEKLDSVGLEQVKQRIALRARLDPLDRNETREYIERRLTIAGMNSEENTPFSDQTTAALHYYSRGIPRLINILCENSLITAYSTKLQSVTPEIVEKIAKDLHLNAIQSSDARSSNDLGGIDNHRATYARFELYSVSHTSNTNGLDVGTPDDIQESKHERTF